MGACEVEPRVHAPQPKTKPIYQNTQKQVKCQLFSRRIATVAEKTNGNMQDLIIDTGSSLSTIERSKIPEAAKIVKVRTRVKRIASKVWY